MERKWVMKRAQSGGKEKRKTMTKIGLCEDGFGGIGTSERRGSRDRW